MDTYRCITPDASVICAGQSVVGIRSAAAGIDSSTPSVAARATTTEMIEAMHRDRRPCSVRIWAMGSRNTEMIRAPL